MDQTCTDFVAVHKWIKINGTSRCIVKKVTLIENDSSNFFANVYKFIKVLKYYSDIIDSNNPKF